MTTSERRESGFPVEIGLFDRRLIKSREAGSDPVYAFTFSPDEVGEGIFCEAPGERPGSIAWGMTLDPVPNEEPMPASHVIQASALYIETTGPELRRFIEGLQSLFDVNFNADGSLRSDDKAIRLDRDPRGNFVITHIADGEDFTVQTDYDYPGIASTFGFNLTTLPMPDGRAGASPSDWCPTNHDGTDGTVPCPGCGLPASFFIEAARDYLSDNIGLTADDPGYFPIPHDQL